jgi:putative membrane protein
MWDWADHMGGWWWGLGLPLMIGFWAAVIWLVVKFARREPTVRELVRTPREILDNRFARGELDEDEYKRRRELVGQ